MVSHPRIIHPNDDSSVRHDSNRRGMASRGMASRGLASRGLASRRSGRSGFTVLEILITVTVVSVAMLPILYLASSNVQGAKTDRIRLVCEALCRSLLERFGRTDDFADFYLEKTSNPRVLVGVDLWKRPEFQRAFRAPELKRLMSYHRVRSNTIMVRHVEPGLHQLTSQVSWRIRRGATVRDEDVSYTRYILDP